MERNDSIREYMITPIGSNTKRAIDHVVVRMAHGVTPAEWTQIDALSSEIMRTDGVALKLNTPRPVRGHAEEAQDRAATDLFCYIGEELIAYATLDGDGDELEMTAAVTVSYRRQGLFRRLIDAAKLEAQRLGAKRLILVNYPRSVTGVAAVNALGFPYTSSEYRMYADSVDIPPHESGTLRLVQVTRSNLGDLRRLRDLTFGNSWPEESLAAGLADPNSRYFIAEVGGNPIGQAGVLRTDQEIYIRAVGIVPEMRRRGYGRQLLSAVLEKMLREGHTKFCLDVSPDNPQALSLYESCGFRTTEAYHYYDIPLA